MPELKRRRIPSLGWLLIAAVVMIVLWVFLAVWLPYHREQVAIREIERLGGSVRTAWDCIEAVSFVYDNRPEWIKSGPEWLQQLVEDGWLTWFDRVDSVYLGITSDFALNFKYMEHVSDDDIRCIHHFNDLTYLNLSSTQISDEGVKYLHNLSKLEFLSLEGTQISDVGIKNLSSMITLEELILHDTQVTDEGVRELQQALPKCRISH